MNNREIAFLVWLAIIVLLILLLPKLRDVRKSFKHVVTSFFQWKMQVVIQLMLTYVLGMVYGLARFGLWDFTQFKNTIVWTLSVAFLLIFQIEAIKKDRKFFRRVVLDNLKLVAIIEFVIGIYSFSLLVEFFLLPVLTIVAVMAVFSERDKKYKAVKNLLNGFLALFGLFLLIRTIFYIVGDTKGFFVLGNFYDFIIPPVLTLLYLPFIFFLMVFMSYENVLVTLPYYIKSKRKRIFATAIAMVIFNVRVKLLERWRFSLTNEDTDSYKGIWKSFTKIFRMRRAENNPSPVTIEQGWSPYTAKEALAEHGLRTGYYKESYGEWFACSPMIDVSDDLFAGNIAYYVDGDEKAAKVLKLILNVNDSDLSDVAEKKLLNVGKSLYSFVFGDEMPDWLQKAMKDKVPLRREIGRYVVELKETPFKNTKRGGYEIKFFIGLSDAIKE